MNEALIGNALVGLVWLFCVLTGLLMSRLYRYVKGVFRGKN